jgi:hypothetical protein
MNTSRHILGVLLVTLGALPAAAQYVTPLSPGEQYPPLNTPDAFVPLPTDVAAYYRNPAAYPHWAYHGPTYRVNVYIDPTLKNRKTKDGLTLDKCAREALCDFYLHCGVGFYEVPSPGQAWYQFYHAGSYDVVAKSQAWQNGYGSGYWASAPDGKRLYLGDQVKPQYGGGPVHSRNYKAFLKRGMFWWYGYQDLTRCVAGSAVNNCLSSPPKYPWTAAGRATHGYGGFLPAEGAFLGQAFDWQPWLYRYQTGLNPQRLELYREEPIEDIGGDEPWDSDRYVAPQRLVEPADPILPPRKAPEHVRCCPCRLIAF